jgi:thiamine-phosphate pyrophosphorylase
LGPIFETETHPGVAGIGLEHLREAVQRTTFPIVAIGGLSERNAGLIARTGAAGVAAIRAFSESDDPAAVAREVRAAFGQ